MTQGELEEIKGDETQQREQIFQQTMRNMKLVIYEYEGQYKGKIYYFDGTSNVARMLLQKIDLLALDDELEDAENNIYDPEFEEFEFYGRNTSSLCKSPNRRTSLQDTSDILRAGRPLIEIHETELSECSNSIFNDSGGNIKITPGEEGLTHIQQGIDQIDNLGRSTWNEGDDETAKPNMLQYEGADDALDKSYSSRQVS